MGALVGAWHAIRRNAETSQTRTTKEKAREFGHDLPKNLRKLQDRLRKGYKFDPAHGATPSKGAGKGKRPLVVAPLPDRIVQRAILDVLQQSTELAGVQAVLETPTSIGGIPGRGVDSAIELIEKAWNDGCKYAAGSDIKGFFTKIPKKDVIRFLTAAVPDRNFVALVEKALEVELANASKMPPEDLHLFPTGNDGVAQGCPLSALAGNIVLRDFDRRMNEPGRGLVCIRYIDDFIILGKKLDHVRKGMAAARKTLLVLGMDTYEPRASPNKAFVGPLSENPEFLGHTLIRGQYPPAPSAQTKLRQSIDVLIRSGQKSIDKALSGQKLKPNEKAFSATVVAISNTMQGWKGSFQSSKCPVVFDDLDAWVQQRVGDFHAYLRSHGTGKSSKSKNMALGIAPLVDPQEN